MASTFNPQPQDISGMLQAASIVEEMVSEWPNDAERLQQAANRIRCRAAYGEDDHSQPKGGDADCPAKPTQTCDPAPSGMPTDGAVGWQPIETAPKDGTHILAALRREGCWDLDGIWWPIFIELREIWFRNHLEFGLNLPWHAGDPFDSYDGMPDTHTGEHVPIRWMPLPAGFDDAINACAEALGATPPPTRREVCDGPE